MQEFQILDRKALLGRILNTGIEITHGGRGTVYLGNSLIAIDLEGKELPAAIDKNIADRVFQTQLALMINDRAQSILAVPLRTPSGRTLGVVEILNSKKGQFDDQDLKVLQALAVFAAVALEYREKIDVLSPQTPVAAAPPEGAKILVFDLRKGKERFELDLIQQALHETGGNKSQAAKLLGITREGLRKAMKKAA